MVLTWIKAAGQFPLNHILYNEYIGTFAQEGARPSRSSADAFHL